MYYRVSQTNEASGNNGNVLCFILRDITTPRCSSRRLGGEPECAAAPPPPPAPRTSVPYPPVFSQPMYFRPQPSISAASHLPPPIPPHHPLRNYYYTPIDDTDVSPPEEDVFVAVNLPVNDSMSGNEGSSPNAPSASSAYNVNGGGGGSSGGGQSSSASPTHLQRISYQPRRPPPALPPLNQSDDDVITGEEGKLHKDGQLHAKPGDGEGTSDYPYVQFVHERPSSQLEKPLPPPPGGVITFQPPPNHDYYYPVIEGKKPEGQRERRDSIESIKKANQLQEQQLTVASTLSSMGGLGITSISRKEGQASGSLGKGRFGSLSKQEAGKGRGLMGVGKHRDALSSLASVGMKQQCRHCRDSFYAENNPKGSCEYAPDFFRSAIDALTCIGCARCMLYHCMSDKEGEYVRHPCNCSGGCCTGRSKRFPCCCCEGGDRGGTVAGGGGTGDAVTGSEMVGLGANRSGNNVLDNAGSGCGRRWIGLTLLSLLVPCLCCYLPLKGCHSAFVSCGVCGARHEALANGGHQVGSSEDKFGAKHIESKLASSSSGRSSAPPSPPLTTTTSCSSPTQSNHQHYLVNVLVNQQPCTPPDITSALSAAGPSMAETMESIRDRSARKRAARHNVYSDPPRRASESPQSSSPENGSCCSPVNMVAQQPRGTCSPTSCPSSLCNSPHCGSALHVRRPREDKETGPSLIPLSQSKGSTPAADLTFMVSKKKFQSGLAPLPLSPSCNTSFIKPYQSSGLSSESRSQSTGTVPAVHGSLKKSSSHTCARRQSLSSNRNVAADDSYAVASSSSNGYSSNAGNIHSSIGDAQTSSLVRKTSNSKILSLHGLPLGCSCQNSLGYVLHTSQSGISGAKTSPVSNKLAVIEYHKNKSSPSQDQTARGLAKHHRSAPNLVNALAPMMVHSVCSTFPSVDTSVLSEATASACAKSQSSSSSIYYNVSPCRRTKVSNTVAPSVDTGDIAFSDDLCSSECADVSKAADESAYTLVASDNDSNETDSASGDSSSATDDGGESCSSDHLSGGDGGDTVSLLSTPNPVEQHRSSSSKGASSMSRDVCGR
ncbi:Sprouty [Trinorchestia longiramus]|nr:Sprouty [Trinorchestia longiramus]